MSAIRLEPGDCREVLRTLEDCSVDSGVTDPPYALVSIVKRFGGKNAAPAKHGSDGRYARASAGFMGKQWDTGQTAHDPAFWAEVLRVLKPGAHLVAFAGTRTYHRMACAIEDAGFEIRDQLAWMYGSGFPKSHDVAKHTKTARRWEGWGTALKPAWEPIVLARKPLEGTVAANVLQHGTGAINIDGCRVEGIKPQVTQGVNSNPSSFAVARERRLSGDPMQGRWPANVAHDASEEVLMAFDAFGERKVGTDVRKGSSGSDKNGNGGSAYGAESRPAGTLCPSYGDTGSAARFFFSAKAGAEDRWGSKHPTVKPVELIRWLARLITPPGGTLLDPFAGSGTAGVAALAEGFNAILIEREEEYLADIRERLAFYSGEGRHSLASKNRKATPRDSTPLLDAMGAV